MAIAQTAPAAGPVAGEGQDTSGDIVVTGIRQSLSRAAEIKRESTAVVDSIVAEDIGKLPDLTTASALQRVPGVQVVVGRSEEHTSELQSLMRISYAVFCLKKKKRKLKRKTSRKQTLLTYTNKHK